MAFNSSFIYGLLEGLTCQTNEKLNIVQVGANDGITNDPLNQWVINNLTNHNLTLIEPQEDVFKTLKENYALHPSATFHNKAIGKSGSLALYRIGSQFNHLYKGITASGITSYNRKYVLNKITKNLNIPEGANPEDYLEKFEVQMLPLVEILNNIDRPAIELDFLQIDTEGFDDQVIYHANLEKLQPYAINFEFIHLSHEKQNKLYGYLNALHYKIIHWSSEDACAIRNTASQ